MYAMKGLHRSSVAALMLLATTIISMPGDADAQQQPSEQDILSADALRARLAARHLEDVPTRDEVAAMDADSALPVLLEVAFDESRIYSERSRALRLLGVFDDGVQTLLDAAADAELHPFLRTGALRGLTISACPRQAECVAAIDAIDASLLSDPRLQDAIADFLSAIDTADTTSVEPVSPAAGGDSVNETGQQ